MKFYRKHVIQIAIICVLLILLMASVLAQGQGPPPGGLPQPGGKPPVGQVTSVSSTSITISTMSGDTATYAISSSTTVTLDGQAASISDLVDGDCANITSSDGTNATEVDARSAPPPRAPPPGGPAFSIPR